MSSTTRRELQDGAALGGVSRVSNRIQAERLCADVLRKDRAYPIVGISCTYRRRDPPLDPMRVRERIWLTVPIYVIESREARVLSALLPDAMGAYNGAARVWHPGVDEDSEARWHPLIYDSTGTYGDDALDRLAAEFAHEPPKSPADLSDRERSVLQLRSVPRASGEQGRRQGPVVPVATRKDLRRLATDLRSPDRDYPIVVLTFAPQQSEPVFTPRVIRARIDPHVPIYVLGTDELSRRLGERLPANLGVTGGDARIFWPGAHETEADPEHHPVVSAHESGPPDDRLVATLELSRPSVREHVAALRARLRRAKQQAADAATNIRDARRETDVVSARADAAETRLGEVDGLLAAIKDAGLDEHDLVESLDLDGRLHRLIGREWLRSLPSAPERRAHPLRYTFGSDFLGTVEALEGTPINRIAWVAAMVACGRAKEVSGIDPHHLRQRRAGSSDQRVRDDGAKAWTCKLNGEGASRLAYWLRRDGLAELAAVSVHDAIGLFA
jgi:hypothetical protein